MFNVSFKSKKFAFSVDVEFKVITHKTISI